MYHSLPRTILVGAIIGFIAGVTGYIVPTKLLLTIQIQGIMIPSDLQSDILLLSVVRGGGLGAFLGVFCGMSVWGHRLVPVGQLTQTTCALVATITYLVGFIWSGHFPVLFEGTWPRILLFLVWSVLFVPFMAFVGLPYILVRLEKIARS